MILRALRRYVINATCCRCWRARCVVTLALRVVELRLITMLRYVKNITARCRFIDAMMPLRFAAVMPPAAASLDDAKIIYCRCQY